MKFAKDLERDLVPEWRAKYLDYRIGKKKLKAISRALRNVNRTPRTPHSRGPNPFTPSPFKTAPEYSFLNRLHSREQRSEDAEALSSRIQIRRKSQGEADLIHRSKLQDSAEATNPERQPLTGNQIGPALRRYGSIIGSPPNHETHESLSQPHARKPPLLALPEPAMDPEPHSPPSVRLGHSGSQERHASFKLPPATDMNAFEVGDTVSPSKKTASLPHRYRSLFTPKRVNSMPGVEGSRPALSRFLSFSGKSPRSPANPDVPLEAYREVDVRQAEFFTFLDLELEKIDEFYKLKEEEATHRLKILREQLHIMRDRRLEELIVVQTAKMKHKHHKAVDGSKLPEQSNSSDSDENGKKKHKPNGLWKYPLDAALGAAKFPRNEPKLKSKGMEELGTPTALRPQGLDERRDYTRRPDIPDIPYRSAKRKLKVALQEFYRGLELLKSYALLNRTAFRKITKKYDKTVNARPSGRYMSEKVNSATFVTSDVIDGHIRAVEDLYARYFEQGNHKVAVNKLRIKSLRAGDYTDSAFRNGLLVAIGAVFGIEGLVKAVQNLYQTDDLVLATNTSYLLQLYGGYFTMLLLMMLFCLDCRFWLNSKINYVFVFEFDTRHHLDWRQLFELPSFFLTLLGFILWLNFNNFGSETIFLYYPVILIGITALALFLPLPTFQFRTRSWFLYSNWRLFWAGLYPVEFRDFFLGDMFCSLTYAMGNIELFFCLYARDWQTPAMCNSSHSRLLGFFACLPGIWRALQCLRRYYDTRNIFPHLVNCGKYGATILYYVTLSIYRIEKSNSTKIAFIFFALINAIYTSIWDVVMDWSLGDPSAKYPFLRDTLGYKQIWIYYVAMVLDPILRFQWIPYAIWTTNVQHSAMLSFALALIEVFRRGMWTIFRVENEHCTNVGRFRASRDVPLPYELPIPALSPSHHPRDFAVALESVERIPTVSSNAATSTGVDLEAGRTRTHESTNAPGTPSAMRRRQSNVFGDRISNIGTLLRNAHAQDFEKKRKPELAESGSGQVDDSDSDTDHEEEDVVAEAHEEFEEEMTRDHLQAERGMNTSA